MSARDDIRFGTVLRHLLDERFPSRRKDFAAQIHLSESALSQYVRGKATPSLQVLVSIARVLEVSLDYLVFGVEPDAPAPDYALITHVEEVIARMQVETATLRDFVGRVGSAIADEIESTAKRLLVDADTVLGGGLTAAEVRELERISIYTRIATADLDPDVVLLPDQEAGPEEGDAVPAPFTPVISTNVKLQREYSYVIPDGPEWRRRARRLRDAVAASGKLSHSAVSRLLRFHAVPRALMPGYVVYKLDRGLVTSRTGLLLDQVSDFVDESTGIIALAEPTSRQTQHFSLIDTQHHHRIVNDHDSMTRVHKRLPFD